jgi:hypothetical protein
VHRSDYLQFDHQTQQLAYQVPQLAPQPSLEDTLKAVMQSIEKFMQSTKKNMQAFMQSTEKNMQ